MCYNLGVQIYVEKNGSVAFADHKPRRVHFGD
jgi:hypothetical protein